ncbi:M20/M25/M40 family metallo-hydrolase [Siccirubricoccus sp. G192]|uniref:M20/M25/M40 family metallo-hydrolase n=1 Tax=Siccirubricoccus sp. G192 TaxID=2849651 RepID=UPI001C2BA205|nr:M20/M25/M40 family metallo-hydrolase [Siccirubricoccus sp. G192]MBV1795587.1 M20/M25/M40 family metallo-hydrolase [Siccirubricoccus sp. G192]MBV1800262.1 M20/M25/M40 family metallo-hydrolase [Siccirubricoccus sp. G192]
MDAPALDLPFDAEAMLPGLRRWVECESPTFDAAAVARMMEIAGRDLALMGARIETIPGRLGYGPCLRASFPHPRAHEPGILVMGHLDTVHPIGTLGPLPWRREGNRVYGPGIYDMKGGNYIAIEAIRQLLRAGIATSRPVTVLLTSDEEVGSPSTRDLIEAEAARHAVVLVPEPARPDGGVVTGRYAIARFNLRTTGKPSHAGARLADGRSAIREMCRQVVAIEAMTSDAVTYSIGVIHGGQWVNCVATHCDAESLSMAKRQEDLDEAVERMLSLRPTGNDVQLAVTRGVTRPVWEPDERGMALYATARGIAQRIGFDISSQSSGGGSDGNFTGAMGVPTLDGLGVQGAGGHTLEEHLILDSLVPRARLLAGLLQVA